LAEIRGRRFNQSSVPAPSRDRICYAARDRADQVAQSIANQGFEAEALTRYANIVRGRAETIAASV